MIDKDNTFLTEKLKELVEKHSLPQNIAPQLLALFGKYPNLDIQGAKQDLTDDLEKLVNSIFQEGKV